MPLKRRMSLSIISPKAKQSCLKNLSVILYYKSSVPLRFPNSIKFPLSEKENLTNGSNLLYLASKESNARNARSKRLSNTARTDFQSQESEERIKPTFIAFSTTVKILARTTMILGRAQGCTPLARNTNHGVA